jgi:2-amino-4-hydroxy-6-hydroxymethyldihydropteridine diphosphokinase
MPISSSEPVAAACLGLGSNLGDSIATIERALDLLNQENGIQVRKTASLYRTEPIGVFAPIDIETTVQKSHGHSKTQSSNASTETEPQWFINTVTLIDTTLSAEELLDILLATEQRLGRVRQAGHGYQSRTLDIDLLLYGEAIIHKPFLELPHPHLHERAFVLAPLTELVPDWVHPGLGKTIHSLYHALDCGDQRVERITTINFR